MCSVDVKQALWGWSIDMEGQSSRRRGSNGSESSSENRGLCGREGRKSRQRMQVAYLLNENMGAPSVSRGSVGRGKGGRHGCSVREDSVVGWKGRNVKVRQRGEDGSAVGRQEEPRTPVMRRRCLERGSSGSGMGTPTSIMKTGSGGNGEKKKKVERRYMCDRCGFAFGMKSNLKRHVATVHEDRRLFRCKMCESAFGLKQNLTTHVRVKHEKRRPFVCGVCGLAFGYKQVLQNHQRSIHQM